MSKILAAAILLDSVIHTLPPPARHIDIWTDMEAKGLNPAPGTQGFIREDYSFCDRTTAYDIAKEAKQIKDYLRAIPGHLYTEDLW